MKKKTYFLSLPTQHDFNIDFEPEGQRGADSALARIPAMNGQTESNWSLFSSHKFYLNRKYQCST